MIILRWRAEAWDNTPIVTPETEILTIYDRVYPTFVGIDRRYNQERKEKTQRRRPPSLSLSLSEERIGSGVQEATKWGNIEKGNAFYNRVCPLYHLDRAPYVTDPTADSRSSEHVGILGTRHKKRCWSGTLVILSEKEPT